MHQGKYIYGSSQWKRKYRACLLGILCLALLCLSGVGGSGSVVYADGVPGGNIADPVVRAVDIAKPAIVRILTLVVAQLQVTLPNGQNVTFPTTPQQGVDGYPLVLSGTGTFISGHGDILTADHVVNPVQDDKAGLDQDLQQTAAQDIADYINQNLKPAQQVTPDQVAQELASGQLVSASQYQQPESRVYLSTDFSGPLSASDFSNVPATQYARVDQVKEHSPFSALDIAIVHVSGMDNMPMVQLGDAAAVQTQDTLKVIGFPGAADVGLKPTGLLTSSIDAVLVSSIKATDSGAPLIQVDGALGPGTSGGPALDNKGQVVGIVSFGPASGGGTAFLRSSDSAKPLIQAAGIDTSPSQFQQLWNKAFNDYASNAAGHWHKAEQEFQQLSSRYQHFQAITPFLQYATAQAQTEQNVSTSPSSGLSSVSPLWIVVGGVALLCIVLLSGVAVTRRKRPAVVTAQGQFGAYPGGYGAYPGSAPTGYPAPQNGPGMVPQTPPAAYQQQATYGQNYQQPPMTPQQPVQGYQPRPVPQTPANPNMAAFGAPPLPTPQPPSASGISDATLVAVRPGAVNASGDQWRTWPCGHTNRLEARFCGICGESAPPV